MPWSPSSPIIWESQIFLTTFNQEQLETRSYDRTTGRLLWTRGVKPEKLETFHSADGSPAASTAATDGKQVVSYFGSFGLVCHDFSGNELWRKPLPVAISAGGYGTGSSPVIIGNRVLVTRDQGATSSLLAVALESGKTLWEILRPEVSGGFGTPVYWRNSDADEVVVPGSGQLKGYDIVTGAERWVVDRTASFVCTTPLVGNGMLIFGAWSQGKADSSFPLDWPSFAQLFDKNGDGKVTLEDHDKVTWEYLRGIDINKDGVITSADLELIRRSSANAENVLLAVRPGGHGDITESHVAWRFSRGLPYVPSPLYYDGRVYIVKDGGLMSSVNANTGEAYYTQERLGASGAYYASPIAADGRIFVASLPGKLSVIKAGGDAPQVLHQVDFGERIAATPALVEDTLYLRTQQHLYAFKAHP